MNYMNPLRCHVALPLKHEVNDYLNQNVDGVSLRQAVEGSLNDEQRRQVLLDQFLIALPDPSDPNAPAAPRLHGVADGHLAPVVSGEPLRLSTPFIVQRIINESILMVLALRLGLKAATPTQIAKAASRLMLPSDLAEAFRRLQDPAGYGMRARRWQRQRAFFLLRARGHAILSQLPLDVFKYVAALTEFD